jgi:ParB-like chromosome segregation protein Spo0J
MIAPDLAALATPIADLKPLPGNPRKGNVDAVARSLARFGQRKPIVCRPDGTIIAGNHTWQAARKLGWDEIAVVRVADDDEEAFAFALADNRTAELGGYDTDALAAMLAEVAHDADLLASTGYTPEDVAALYGDEPDPPPEPEGEVYVTRYEIVVECRDEAHQEEVFARLEQEGLPCRVLTL